MNPLFTPEKFELAKSRDVLPLECNICHSTFTTTKNEIQKTLRRIQENNLRRNELKYCSKQCSHIGNKSGEIIPCKQCGKSTYRMKHEISQSSNLFCSSSCAATYNNTHKTKGNRRSKLEKWIEEQLTILYPNLEIHYNKTYAINSELDIYIPSLKLAFELNGIFHYEEIHGKLSKIQENDNRKFQKCINSEINLCIIDTSHQKRFTEISSKSFLDIIMNIINKKLGRATRIELA